MIVVMMVMPVVLLRFICVLEVKKIILLCFVQTGIEKKIKANFRRENLRDEL